MLVVSSQGSLHSCQDLQTLKLHDLHVSRLKFYDASRTDNPVEVAQVDTDEWEVDRIVEHRGRTKKNYEFRVRWKNFDASDDSWLPWGDVKDLEALDEYFKAHPDLKL